jgi:hypothetical protein
MKYIVMRTNLRTLVSDYYIGGGAFMTDISFAKTYNTKDECPYSEKPIVEEKAFSGEVLNKCIYKIVEK